MIVSLKPKAKFLIVAPISLEITQGMAVLFWRQLCFSEVPELAIVYRTDLKQ
jgi:hypothetical protein